MRKFNPEDFIFSNDNHKEFISSWVELKRSDELKEFLIKTNNESLLNKIEEDNMTAKAYEDIINKLKEENVELRVRLNDVNEECILLDKENRDLKEENKELYKELSDTLEEIWEDHRRDCMYDV